MHSHTHKSFIHAHRQTHQAIKVFGPKIIDNLDKKYSGDRVCKELGFCTGKCQLFPETPADLASPFDVSKAPPNPLAAFGQGLGSTGMPAICNLTVLKPICDAIYGFANDNKPLDDVDVDGFSPIDTLRGADWRGKDCNDKDADIHPGRKVVDSDRTVDSLSLIHI